mgnify:FL=1
MLDKFKNSLSIFFVLVSIYIFNSSLVADYPVYLKLLILLVFFIIAAFVFYSSSTGKTFKSYVLNSTSEVKKVVWPNKKETSQMTLVVFVFVLLMGIFLWLIDSFLSWLIKILLGDY